MRGGGQGEGRAQFPVSQQRSLGSHVPRALDPATESYGPRDSGSANPPRPPALCPGTSHREPQPAPTCRARTAQGTQPNRPLRGPRPGSGVCAASGWRTLPHKASRETDVARGGRAGSAPAAMLRSGHLAGGGAGTIGFRRPGLLRRCGRRVVGPASCRPAGSLVF